MVPLRAPISRCQVASQSKDWKTVRSARCSNAFHSSLTASRSLWTRRLTPELEIGFAGRGVATLSGGLADNGSCC